MYVYYVSGACWEQKNASEALELEVQMVVSHHVGIWNQTLVLCKEDEFNAMDWLAG